MQKNINLTPSKRDIGMIKTLKHTLFFFFLCLFMANALALKSDKEQPIDISADQLEIDDTKNISIYTGNVDLKQGSLHITADKITLYFNDDNELLHMLIIGSPAHLTQLNEEHKLMTGRALKIKYDDQNALLILTGDAEFKSGKEFITSNFIKINTDDDAIQAGTNQPKDRVHITILPKKK